MNQMQKQILIGLLGTIGSGKTTLSDYLAKKHGFYRVIMGDLIREKARQEGLELTRENLGKTQEKYHKIYGKDFLINEALKKLRNSGKTKLLIDGIRTPRQAEKSKEEGALLILVDAQKKIRFARLRARKRENDPQNFEQFKEQEEHEWKLFDFKKTLKYVDCKIDNSRSVKELYKEIDNLLGKIAKNKK